MNTPEEIATLNARLAAWLEADKAKHAAALAALQSDADGSSKTVAALREEVAAYRQECDAQRNRADSAELRLLAVAAILNRVERSGIEDLHDELTFALFNRSL